MITTDVKHKVVSSEEWLAARKHLLAEERAFTRQRDEISRKRRELPWVKVEKQYVFEGPRGRSDVHAKHFDGEAGIVSPASSRSGRDSRSRGRL